MTVFGDSRIAAAFMAEMKRLERCHPDAYYTHELWYSNPDIAEQAMKDTADES